MLLRETLGLLYATSLFTLSLTQLAGPQVSLQGRFFPGQSQEIGAKLPQLASWPSSSVFSSFEGTGFVTVNIAAVPQNGSITYGVNWFRFFIDDAFAADGFTSYNQLYLNVTLNISSAFHTLRIAKMLEASKGEATIESIDIDQEGRFLEPQPRTSATSERRILFLGDSFTVGYGNTGAVLPNTCMPNAQQLQPDWTKTCNALNIKSADECSKLWEIFNENNLEAFPTLASEALGADYQVIAGIGAGVVGYAYAHAQNLQMSPAEYQTISPTNEAMLSRISYADSSSQYNASDWIPKVIVIASGINDFHSASLLYTLEEWLQKGLAFLKQMSDQYGGPSIIFQLWLPYADIQLPEGAGFTELTETQQYLLGMQSLYEEGVKQGIPNLHILNITESDFEDRPTWCNMHPSALAHRGVAQQLVDLIEDLLPDWNATMAVNQTVDQVTIRPDTRLYTAPPQPYSALTG